MRRTCPNHLMCRRCSPIPCTCSKPLATFGHELTGYATLWGVPHEIYDPQFWGFRWLRFARGAFSCTLHEDGPAVELQVGHGGAVLLTTQTGLSIWEDAIGLAFSCYMPGTALAAEIVQNWRNFTGCSLSWTFSNSLIQENGTVLQARGLTHIAMLRQPEVPRLSQLTHQDYLRLQDLGTGHFLHRDRLTQTWSAGLPGLAAST